MAVIFNLLRCSAPALFLGLPLTFSSNFGQTFFISIFASDVRIELDLSHGEFGGIYTAATIISALLFMWLGKLIDYYDYLRMSAASLLGLSLCITIFAGANSAVLLFIGLFGMRLFGQCMLGHIVVSVVAREHTKRRGRALGLATLGYPAGEALIPILVAVCMTFSTWREICVSLAVIVTVIITPAFLWLNNRVRSVGPAGTSRKIETEDARRPWTRMQVLQDPRFYALLPGILSTPFIITGVLFHQIHLIETKNWIITSFAWCYPLYAISATITTLASGWIVDRIRAINLLRFYLLPLAVGLMFLATIKSFYVAPIFMLLMGVTAGGATVLLGAIWAELYGTQHIGAIRSLCAALVVFSTAISPVIMGSLVDVGFGLEVQYLILSAYLIVCVFYFKKLTPSLKLQRAPPT